MPHDTTPITDAELRWAYRMARFADDGISFDQALAEPCLRACLELGAKVRRRRRERLASTNTGAGIERTQPDYEAVP